MAKRKGRRAVALSPAELVALSGLNDVLDEIDCAKYSISVDTLELLQTCLDRITSGQRGRPNKNYFRDVSIAADVAALLATAAKGPSDAYAVIAGRLNLETSDVGRAYRKYKNDSLVAWLKLQQIRGQ